MLLSILDSLDYDYETQHTLAKEELLAKALERSQKDIEEGRILPHSVVMESIKLKYGI